MCFLIFAFYAFVLGIIFVALYVLFYTGKVTPPTCSSPRAAQSASCMPSPILTDKQKGQTASPIQLHAKLTRHLSTLSAMSGHASRRPGEPLPLALEGYIRAVA